MSVLSVQGEKELQKAKRFWVSPYVLEPKESLGAHAVARPRGGLLLKVEFEKGLIGYGDIHPWTELGDLPVSKQRECLANNEPSALAYRSIANAWDDASARARNESAFTDLEVPESHALFTDPTAFTSLDLERVVIEKFQALKFKVGRDLANEKKALESFFGSRSPSPHKGLLRLRLDFNSKTDLDLVRDWLLSFSAELRLAIDFCEDPGEWSYENWQDLTVETGIPFAIDRESSAVFSADALAPAGVILKPAAQDLSKFKNYSSTAFVTSYLDHPVGQMGAAFAAAKLAQEMPVGICGLLSQSAYKANAYSERFPSRGPVFLPDLSDVGFGFTELLEKENWQAV
ncbi:MAG: hypothetical protein EOP05_15275 [Proteobacteria bacterium]|nr:MAG: hypothetical protein EOP05_15275 [Pseudomonadota bacterium]